MTTINSSEMTNFFISKVHGTSISIEDAKKLGVSVDKLENADTDHDGKLTSKEIEVDNDLYAEFASIIIAEQDSKTSDVDQEKEKEKEPPVKEKNGTGV